MNVLGLFVSLIVLSACKGKYIPPSRELCVLGDDYKMACNDPRIGDDSYLRDYQLNYICTNAADYKAVYNYVADMRAKLIKLERKCR